MIDALSMCAKKCYNSWAAERAHSLRAPLMMSQYMALVRSWTSARSMAGRSGATCFACVMRVAAIFTARSACCAAEGDLDHGSADRDEKPFDALRALCHPGHLLHEDVSCLYNQPANDS